MRPMPPMSRLARDDEHACTWHSCALWILVLMGLVAIGLLIPILVLVSQPTECVAGNCTWPNVTGDNATCPNKTIPFASFLRECIISCNESEVCCHGVCYPENALPPGCSNVPGAPGNDIFCEVTTSHCPNGTFCCLDPCGAPGVCLPNHIEGKCRSLGFPGRCGAIEGGRPQRCVPGGDTCPFGFVCCHGLCRDPAHGACKTPPLTFGK